MATTQIDPVKVEEPASPSVLRKRRRRVPTTGASEDCAGCRKQQIKCDRRRPFCSQCVDTNKTCSGYRTTLTWGVGVASRGKLRGMTLPVAQSGQSNQVASTPANRRPRATSLNTPAKAPSTSQNENGNSPRKRPRVSPPKAPPAQPSSLPSSAYPAKSNAVPWQHTDWQRPSFQTHRQSFDYRNGGLRIFNDVSRPELFPLKTSTGTTFGDTPWLASGGGTSDLDTSPITAQSDSSQDPHSSYPPASRNMPPLDLHFPRHPLAPVPYVPQSLQAPTYTTDNLGAPMNQPLKADPAPLQLEQVVKDPLASALDSTVSMQSNPHSTNTTVGQQVNADWTALGTPPFGAAGTLWPQEDDAEEDVKEDSQVLVPRPKLDLKLHRLPARLQHLLNFYDTMICPVLVTRDGADNPYRKHIMHMAMECPGLQNALAALATNNMRMKSLKEAPKYDLDSDSSRSMIRSAIGKPSQEEQYYKSMSITLLNQQLGRSDIAQDDSVLATLLILCLFHVCDSGFSKFKTQLSGVQKLLCLRGSRGDSEFVGWIEMFFAWFDVMTAAVNDRETQIQGESLDMLDLSNNLGKVEQFSGCEGRLFKLIARLGRLNLLSQGRPVKDMSQNSAAVDAVMGGDMRLPSANDFYQLHDDQLDPSKWDQPLSAEPQVFAEPQAPYDDRFRFWSEWHELRNRLQAWQLDYRFSPPETLSEADHQMIHISEAFRHSALLYTERLARPELPASDERFQDLVSKSLFHMAEIGTASCVLKFMLWPLFITGTECVQQTHRALIREMCVAIQMESGFYNNVSGLEVLEKVWREMDREATSSSVSRGCGAQAFRWRKAMSRVDGEYIVI